MTVDFKMPSPESVGDFYNEINKVLAHVQGGNMHYGYWTGPDDDSDFEQAGARLTDMIIERVAAKPGDRVLDLGCGPGKPGVRLARASGAELIGISISTEDVRLANERARAEGLHDRARFQHANMMALPFEDNSFDHVMAIESIVHIPDRAQVLTEVARVLRPGGRVVLTDFVVRGDAAKNRGAYYDQTLVEVFDSWRTAPPVTAEDYRSFATTAGLVVDEINDITENVKYTGLKTYLALREYARTHDLPPALQRIVDVAVGHSDLTDRQVTAWWTRMLQREQSEGKIIVVAHLPEA